MGTSSIDQLDAFERAKYKLRQAELALGYLRQVSNDIAADLRRGIRISDRDVRLDTFFFSCLGLAKSAYYIISDHQSGRYEHAIRSWKLNELNQDGRTHFNRMMKLRDKDVHRGQSDGKILPTAIPMERNSDAWMYQPQPNYAVLGIERTITEHKTPDGSTVRSYDGLQGTMSLYVDVAGRTLEASKACEQFIAQLDQLIAALRAANLPSLGPLQRLFLWLSKKLGLRD